MKQRVIRVSSTILEMLLTGDLRGPVESTAPKDLKIRAIYPDQDFEHPERPPETYHVVVDSKTFGDIPERSDPFIEPRFTIQPKGGGRLVRWFRKLRAVWRAA